MALTVKPVTLPSSLAGVSNGRLPSGILVPIHQRGMLERNTARAWTALVAHSGEVGLPLTFTYGGCYRTFDEQYNLFFQRFTRERVSSTSRTYNGVTYYLIPGQALASTPGNSNHGLGLAIDAAFDTDPRDGLGPDDAAYIAAHPQFEWWKKAVLAHGFSFEAQSENWHIRLVCGDRLPKIVTAWEKTQPWFAPERALFGDWPEKAKKPVLKIGGKTNDPDAVRYLQGVLLYRCGQLHVTVDGKFGQATHDAVKEVERWLGKRVDGAVGAPLWRVFDRLAG